jgi:hypothetical protein
MLGLDLAMGVEIMKKISKKCLKCDSYKFWIAPEKGSTWHTKGDEPLMWCAKCGFMIGSIPDNSPQLSRRQIKNVSNRVARELSMPTGKVAKYAFTLTRQMTEEHLYLILLYNLSDGYCCLGGKYLSQH